MEALLAQSFADLDKARTAREHHYESCIPEAKVEVSDYAKTVLRGYAQFIEQCYQSRVRYVLADFGVHVCSASCRWLQQQDAYICRRGGHLHICDTAHCDERRDHAGDYTCQLTGKKYGKHFDLDTDERSGSHSQFIEEKIKPTKAPKPKGPRPPRVRSKTGVKGRKIAKLTQQKQDETCTLRATARNTLMTMLRGCGQAVPESLLDSFSALCVRLWFRVRVAAEKTYRALKYRFPYHCYVVMYYMQTGLDVGDIPILPAVDFFVHHLPSMKQLGKYGIKTKWHTKCTKQFLWALQAISEEELQLLSQSLSAAWPAQ